MNLRRVQNECLANWAMIGVVLMMMVVFVPGGMLSFVVMMGQTKMQV